MCVCVCVCVCVFPCVCVVCVCVCVYVCVCVCVCVCVWCVCVYVCMCVYVYVCGPVPKKKCIGPSTILFFNFTIHHLVFRVCVGAVLQQLLHGLQVSFPCRED